VRRLRRAGPFVDLHAKQHWPAIAEAAVDQLIEVRRHILDQGVSTLSSTELTNRTSFFNASRKVSDHVIVRS
jgi:hypothetical protein